MDLDALALLVIVSLTLVVGWCGGVRAGPKEADWSTIEASARGQTVYWHAWGGSSAVNDFIAWTASQVAERHGVRVEHVKLADVADAVSRVIAEKAAGRAEDGAVDLLWVNGENFAALKAQQLLFGPWVEQLPNWRLVDTGNPVLTEDFTVPVEGLEAPWAMAQLVFFHDSVQVTRPPRSIPALLEWARANPGRFAYPQPPDFLGSTFLKQALYELTPDAAVLQRPVTEADYGAATAPLWRYLEALRPHLWRSGAAYPQSGPRLVQLLADGELDIGFSFNPNEAANAIANHLLPPSVRTYVLSAGTIGNASFLAIPFNASAKAGAMVVANFLLSPEAQARMQDPEVWGSGTVLDLDRLTRAERVAFDPRLDTPGAIAPEALGTPLPEPHPSWMTRLEEDWIERFGVGR